MPKNPPLVPEEWAEIFADAVAEIVIASHAVCRSVVQNRGTKTAISRKRRAIDRMWLDLFGRKATDAEHDAMTTNATGYY